jgi:hypothetical protein
MQQTEVIAGSMVHWDDRNMHAWVQIENTLFISSRDEDTALNSFFRHDDWIFRDAKHFFPTGGVEIRDIHPMRRLAPFQNIVWL